MNTNAQDTLACAHMCTQNSRPSSPHRVSCCRHLVCLICLKLVELQQASKGDKGTLVVGMHGSSAVLRAEEQMSHRP